VHNENRSGPLPENPPAWDDDVLRGLRRAGSDILYSGYETIEEEPAQSWKKGYVGAGSLVAPLTDFPQDRDYYDGAHCGYGHGRLRVADAQKTLLEAHRRFYRCGGWNVPRLRALAAQRAPLVENLIRIASNARTARTTLRNWKKEVQAFLLSAQSSLPVSPAGHRCPTIVPRVVTWRRFRSTDGGADQRRVVLLATAVIAVVVRAMVRDVPLTLFMVLATWPTYGATLTLSDLFFVRPRLIPAFVLAA
jgi:hypothetical protein